MFNKNIFLLNQIHISITKDSNSIKLKDFIENHKDNKL